MDDKTTALLDKTEKILKANQYSGIEWPWGKYGMISPGKGIFKGIWNWDSAFHAIGMLSIDPVMAEEQIEGFLQFQMDDGMLPDVILEDGEIENHYTKPPVMAWAAVEVYKQTRNIEFLRRVYPCMVRNEEFWVEKRSLDGLLHYDADRSDNCDEEKYLTRVRYESGWDDSPRWDGMPQNYWAVDLNCFMVMHYRALAFMAEELEKASDIWKQKETALTSLIEKRLWNEQLKAYTDYNFVEKKYTDALTPASFMPLYIGIAGREQAIAMSDIAEKHFFPGMPTIAYDNKAYSTTYWRGPCWLNVAYFAVKGLKNYGFDKLANGIRDTILNWVYEDGEHVHENYDAKTGEGLCCDHFSWSCVFVRELLLNWQ